MSSYYYFSPENYNYLYTEILKLIEKVSTPLYFQNIGHCVYPKNNPERLDITMSLPSKTLSLTCASIYSNLRILARGSILVRHAEEAHFFSSGPKICSLSQSQGWISQNVPTTEATLQSTIASMSRFCGLKALGSMFIKASKDFFVIVGQFGNFSST